MGGHVLFSTAAYGRHALYSIAVIAQVLCRTAVGGHVLYSSAVVVHAMYNAVVSGHVLLSTAVSGHVLHTHSTVVGGHVIYNAAVSGHVLLSTTVSGYVLYSTAVTDHISHKTVYTLWDSGTQYTINLNASFSRFSNFLEKITIIQLLYRFPPDSDLWQ